MRHKERSRSIDADTDTAGRGHAVLKGKKELLINLLRLPPRLLLEALALHVRVIELGIPGGNLLTVDD